MIPDVSYELGMPGVKIEFPQWKDSLGGNQCGDIMYSAIADNKILDSSWIKFDGSSRQFTI